MAKGISRKGGERRSLAERRIAENFAYATAVGMLHRKKSRVTRMKTFRGPLPGIYRRDG